MSSDVAAQGLWRLLVPFNVMGGLGYSYVLQVRPMAMLRHAIDVAHMNRLQCTFDHAPLIPFVPRVPR